MVVAIPDKEINSIAQNLEMGMNCWYHIPTGETLMLPDERKNSAYDEEMWEDELKKIKKNKKESIFFGGPDNRDEFKIMERFAEQEVSDSNLQTRLIEVLQLKKPFAGFKSTISNSHTYLNAWYAYKTNAYETHVKNILDSYNHTGLSEDDNLNDEDDLDKDDG